MNTYSVRPGEFRICPQCSARQKGGYSRCQSCGSSLEGAVIAERVYAPTYAPRPINRGLRAVLVLAVVGAAAIGMVLRNTFNNAAFDQEAKAAAPDMQLSVNAAATPDPSVYDRIAVIEPAASEAWYGLRSVAPPPPPPRMALPPVTPSAAAQAAIVEPANHAAIVDPANTVAPAAEVGMVGLAPRPRARIARRALAGAVLTNDDLADLRSTPDPQVPSPVEQR